MTQKIEIFLGCADKNGKDLGAYPEYTAVNLLSAVMDGFTLVRSIGVWQGTQERSLYVVRYGALPFISDYERLRNRLRQFLEATNQTAALLVIDGETETITLESDA